MSLKQFLLAPWLLIVPLACASESSGYVGAAVCGQCHRTISATQVKSNMAQTWQGVATRLLPAIYREERTEGPTPMLSYRALRANAGLQFETTLPGRAI